LPLPHLPPALGPHSLAQIGLAPPAYCMREHLQFAPLAEISITSREHILSHQRFVHDACAPALANLNRLSASLVIRCARCSRGTTLRTAGWRPSRRCGRPAGGHHGRCGGPGPAHPRGSLLGGAAHCASPGPVGEISLRCLPHSRREHNAGIPQQVRCASQRVRSRRPRDARHTPGSRFSLRLWVSHASSIPRAIPASPCHMLPTCSHPTCSACPAQP
jgi:hypothetical protein